MTDVHIALSEDLARFTAYGEANPGWGNLHIALDDYNLEDDHIQWCIANAIKEKDEEAQGLGGILLKMTYEEREVFADYINTITAPSYFGISNPKYRKGDWHRAYRDL